MHPTNLTPHPEGGSYKRVFCSERIVHDQEKKERAALSHIYFKLDKNEISSLHRVTSDEVWNLYQGVGINLYLWDGTTAKIEKIELSPENNKFCHVVPAGCWQAAEPITGKVILGCSVAPAFNFEDFTLLKNTTSTQKIFKENNPKYLYLL